MKYTEIFPSIGILFLEGKHDKVIAEYFKTINYPNKETKSIENYNEIHFKRYSDFPNVFKYLDDLCK